MGAFSTWLTADLLVQASVEKWLCSQSVCVWAPVCGNLLTNSIYMRERERRERREREREKEKREERERERERERREKEREQRERERERERRERERENREREREREERESEEERERESEREGWMKESESRELRIGNSRTRATIHLSLSAISLYLSRDSSDLTPLYLFSSLIYHSLLSPCPPSLPLSLSLNLPCGGAFPFIHFQLRNSETLSFRLFNLFMCCFHLFFLPGSIVLKSLILLLTHFCSLFSV